MSALQLVGFGVASALLSVTLRKTRPEMALVVSLAAGVCILLSVVERLRVIVELLSSLASRAEISDSMLPLLLRIVGVAALCEIGVQVCKDADENGLAAKIEMGGKLMVLALALPIAVSLVDLVLGILP